MFLPNPGIMAAGAGVVPVGQQLFTATGPFIVPADVFRICAVVIGRGGDSVGDYAGDTPFWFSGAGGGLAYSNNVIVTPGETLEVFISSNGVTISRGPTVLLWARNGREQGVAGDGITGDVRRSGGRGTGWDDRIIPGAGAAGYTSNGEPSTSIDDEYHGGGGTSPYGGGAGASAGGASGGNGAAYGGGGASGGFRGGPGCARIIWGPGRAFPNTNTGDMT